jgi:hypothetical protein
VEALRMCPSSFSAAFVSLTSATASTSSCWLWGLAFPQTGTC